jgi:predicted ATPase
MRLELENYRCFRQATVDFGPLTVLIGANASGKSTLLRALSPLAAIELSDLDRWQGLPGLTVSMKLTRHGKPLFSGALYAAGPRSVTPSGTYEYQLLRLSPDRLRLSGTVEPQLRLRGDGENLAQVVDTLSRADQHKLAEDFRRLVPVFGDVDRIAGPNSGQVSLRFQDRWNPGRWYGTAEVSDGTLYTLAFLLLAHQKPPLDVLAIEDPDHGVHPFLLGEIVGVLRKLATGALTGRPMHIVLTTHSPTLLEFVEPNEVRLLNRQEDGSVLVDAIPESDPHWRSAFKIYGESLSQAWLSGGLGGTP